MSHLLRSEVRKLTSTRMLLGLTLGGIGLVVFYVMVIVFTAGDRKAGNDALVSLSDAASVRAVYGVPFEVGYLMPLLMGVFIISGEFRHRTITPTFLVTPRRWRVLAAKALVAAGAGVVMGVVLTAVATGLGAALIAAKGYPVRLGSDGVPRLLVLMCVGLGVWAVFGLGFGALLRNQVAAVVVAIVLVTVVEGLLAVFLRWVHLGVVARLLPAAASNAMVQPSNVTPLDLLPWWAGGLVLLGWGIVSAFLGSLLTLRRDVT